MASTLLQGVLGLKQLSILTYIDIPDRLRETSAAPIRKSIVGRRFMTHGRFEQADVLQMYADAQDHAMHEIYVSEGAPIVRVAPCQTLSLYTLPVDTHKQR